MDIKAQVFRVSPQAEWTAPCLPPASPWRQWGEPFSQAYGMCISSLWHACFWLSRVLWRCHFLLHWCPVWLSFVRHSLACLHLCIHSFNQNRPSKFQHNPNAPIFSFMSNKPVPTLAFRRHAIFRKLFFLVPSVSAPSLVCVRCEVGALLLGGLDGPRGPLPHPTLWCHFCSQSMRTDM